MEMLPPRSDNSVIVFWFLLILTSINLICFAQSLIPSTNETDRLALLAFKDQISDDPNRALSSWNDSVHFCMWNGVTCGRRHSQRVTALHFINQSLVGYLSPHIGNLSFLKDIHLSSNSFQGHIPQEDNSLDGSIPQEVGKLVNLRELEMAKNKLYEYGTGAISSTSGDVYSYGIVLLEMLTGKRPSDDMFENNLSLHQFAKMALPERVMEIIDHGLLLEEIEIIGNSENSNNIRRKMQGCCSHESPKERMEMKDVVIEMQKVKDFYLRC